MVIKMKKMLAEDGTLHIIHTPYCPNQNSIAERYIRTLVEMAKTMLIHACMPIYANYVRNHVTTRALGFIATTLNDKKCQCKSL